MSKKKIPSELDITLNTETNRFELVVDEKMSFLEFRLFDGGIILAHTEVHPDLEGQGIGSALAKHAIEYVRTNQLKLVVVCPFVKAYLRRHPEMRNIASVE